MISTCTTKADSTSEWNWSSVVQINTFVICLCIFKSITKIKGLARLDDMIDLLRWEWLEWHWVTTWQIDVFHQNVSCCWRLWLSHTRIVFGLLCLLSCHHTCSGQWGRRGLLFLFVFLTWFVLYFYFSPFFVFDNLFASYSKQSIYNYVRLTFGFEIVKRLLLLATFLFAVRALISCGASTAFIVLIPLLFLIISIWLDTTGTHDVN